MFILGPANQDSRRHKQQELDQTETNVMVEATSSSVRESITDQLMIFGLNVAIYMIK